MSDTGDTSRTDLAGVWESGALVVDHETVRKAVSEYLRKQWRDVEVLSVLWVPNRDRSMPVYLSGHFQIDVQWSETAKVTVLSPRRGSVRTATGVGSGTQSG